VKIEKGGEKFICGKSKNENNGVKIKKWKFENIAQNRKMKIKGGNSQN